MVNIIIHQHNILIEITDKDVSMPMDTSLEIIKDHLIPIHVTESHFVATVTSQEILPENQLNLQFLNLRQALSHFDTDTIKEIVYFQQLNDYYTNHQYCGKCGNHTTRRPINKFVFCESCQTENYPHIAPCVIVRIHKDDKILMARGVNFPPNAWGLIAGFMEIGESLEEAAQREVKEEVGIEIQNLKYWGSQPWPFPNNSLMVGFTADYKSGEVTPDVTEIEAAGFYGAHELPGQPSTTFSIASKMIQEFCK